MNKWTFILGLALAVALYFCFHFWSENNQAKNISSGKEDTTVNHWKDMYGKEHATLQQTQESAAAAQILHANELDSMAKVYKVSKNAFKEVTNEQTKTDISKTADSTNVTYGKTNAGDKGPKDSTGCPLPITRLSGLFKDNWMRFTATLGDVNTLVGYTTDTTGYRRYTKGFFSPKTYLDITHRSPYVHSVDIQSYEVEDASSPLQVALFAGYGYSISSFDLKQPTPVFGIGLSYKLFSLGKK